MTATGPWVALAGVTLAALWGVGGFLVFLVGPIVSGFPPLWGGVLGVAAFLLQLLLGERLLRGLLRLRPDPPEDLGLKAWIDEERPFLLALGSGPDVVATRGLLERFPEDLGELVSGLKVARSGLPGALLTRALALPCLFRAFESAVGEYGRLRGGAGPLWFLGRGMRIVAVLLEAPLRLLANPPPESGPSARRRLQMALVATRRFPAWMEALDLLAPVCLTRIRREARIVALLGVSGLEEDPAPSRPDHLGCLAPWLGLLAGLVLARLPGGVLAAPLVLTALALLFRLYRALPLGRPGLEGLEILWERARTSGRGIPVRVQGEIVEAPADLAVPDGDWLEVDGGRILLLEAPRCEGKVEITGWMRPAKPEILVGTLRQSGSLRRSLPLLRRLFFPLSLGAAGAAWWILQTVGL
ncbi:MAG: hypothetical protein ACOX9B_01055 [Candidatus Xenobium sp.]|nr:hypothetical protein [Burkholderiales bacterium]